MFFRLAIVFCLMGTACSAASSAPTTITSVAQPSTSTTTTSSVPLIDSRGDEIPAAPVVPTTPLDDATITAIEQVWAALPSLDAEPVAALGATGDARIGWLLSDLLRFFQGAAVGHAAVEAFNQLTGGSVGPLLSDRPWNTVTNLLIAWDLAAPPGYAEYKERLFTFVEPGWQPFFDDAESEVDWRLVNWGGVLIDDRELGDPNPCVRGCIPALDDPVVTNAAGGAWYPDESIVFAIELNGEARAYPKNIMEVHEMVNDTLGGRRIGMPYCTLCGSAQAFLTDVVPEGVDELVLRTSGLLARSNKVMYDLGTQSMFDTFLGEALTGPLRVADFVLEPVPVVTTTWGEWKQQHPATTIVAQDGGRGLFYPDDPLQGRDDDGPIFPVGDVDPRLPVQEQVLGVVSPDGMAIAFPVSATREALEAGQQVSVGGVEVVLDGGGLRAVADGANIGTHQAFWFAWSQFRPETLLWEPQEGVE